MINVENISPSQRPLLKGGSVALGFFDGCHLGHQEILKRCLALGSEQSAVLTFPEHPGLSIPGRQPPPLLTTAEERIELLESLGMKVFLRSFDREFSTWSSERFVEELLVDGLGVAHVVVGHDYRFGHRAAGDVDKLRRLGQEHGFEVTVVPAVSTEEGEPLIISSTKIRQAVAEGELELAARLLGRPYTVSAKVVSGQRRGRTIGFPTANLVFPSEKVQPPYGVLAVRVKLPSGEVVPGVANFGLRPTVEAQAEEPRLEVHLFDFSADLYEQTLKVELISGLREERKFASFEELRAQIERDAQAAKALLLSGG